MITTSRQLESRKFYDKNINNEFGKSSFFYPFLRQGLFMFLRNKKYKTVLLPSYVAEGIIDPFKKLDYLIRFYDVDEKGVIDKRIFDQAVDVFVYIHYFGIYHKENIKIIQENIKSNTLFVEDFAHTVYNNELIFTGDICTFSFTKTIGLTEGSCILFNKINNTERCVFKNQKKITNKLRLILYFKLIVATYFKCRIGNSLLNKTLSVFGYADYYSLLMNTYTSNYPSLPTKTIHKLMHVDFEKITEIRQKYARMYYEKLNPELLYDFPREAYLLQALFAFPIKVSNRAFFIKELYKMSILPLTLTSNWWFNDNGNKYFYDTHLLLPINQNLSEREIFKVIKSVNSIKCD